MHTARIGPVHRYVLLAALAFGAPPALAGGQPQTQVEGKVLQVFPTAMIIQKKQGEATVLQLSPRTRLGAPFKPGDRVVAHITPYGVSSVQPRR